MYKSKRKLNKQQFNKWYLSFLKQYGGISPDPKDWYSKCLEKKKTLIDLMGSHQVTHTFKESNRQLTIPWVHVSGVFNSLDYIVQDKEKLTQLKHLFTQRYTTDEHGREIRTTRFLRRELSESLKKTAFNAPARLDSILNNLATIQGKRYIDSCNLKFIMTVDPKNFVQLGTFFPRAGSCYHQKNGTSAKYLLSQSVNTFVILVYNKNSLQHRSWGYCTEDCSTFVVTNRYFASGASDGHIDGLMPEFIAKIMKKKMSDIIVRYYVRPNISHGLYTNGDSVMITSNKNLTHPPDLEINPDPVTKVNFSISPTQAEQEFKQLAGI